MSSYNPARHEYLVPVEKQDGTTVYIDPRYDDPSRYSKPQRIKSTVEAARDGSRLNFLSSVVYPNNGEWKPREYEEVLERKMKEYFTTCPEERDERIVDWLEENQGEHILRIVPSAAEYDQGEEEVKTVSIHFRMRTAINVNYRRHLEHGYLPVALGRKVETVIDEAINGKPISPTNGLKGKLADDFRADLKRSEYFRLDLSRVVEIWPHGDESQAVKFELDRDLYRRELAAHRQNKAA
jgi:hypothetical protein